MTSPPPEFDIAGGDPQLSAHLRQTLLVLRARAPYDSATRRLLDDALAHRRSLRDVARHPEVLAFLDGLAPLRPEANRPSSHPPHDATPTFGSDFNIDNEDYGGQDGHTFLRRARG